jgi:hypothetical protein
MEQNPRVVLLTAPWPWSLLNLGSALVTVAAIVVAWKSAVHVRRERRARTRAWRILACGIGGFVAGICVPLGAAYVLVQYGPQTTRRRAPAGSS